jgi:hypothetical protein
MSLINDALRRASQTEKDRPPSPSSPLRMEAAPVEQRSAPPWVWMVTILITVVLAGWCFWQWSNARPTVQQVVGLATPKVEPTPVPALAPVVVKATPQTAPAAVVVSPPSVPPVAVVPPKPVEESWPSGLKLKGIFYNRFNPHVLINSDTLRVGETVKGVRVLKIDQDKVTLEWNGRTKILMMGED